MPLPVDQQPITTPQYGKGSSHAEMLKAQPVNEDFTSDDSAVLLHATKVNAEIPYMIKSFRA
jgi:hypothetical protein